jgi:hypothetical protein
LLKRGTGSDFSCGGNVSKGTKEFMSAQEAQELYRTISDTGPLNDEKLELLRRQLPGMNTLGISTTDYATLKVSIELLAAIRNFDKASGDLTRRIFWLTVVFLVVGTVQTIFTVLTYLKG